MTPETIVRVDELERFFTDLDCTSVGFNLEEQEGVNAHRPAITVADAEAFWLRLWQLRGTGSLAVRDLDRFCDWLNARQSGDHGYGSEPIDPIPTVAFNGDVVVLSPELAGIRDRTHWNFKVGDVLRDSLPTILRTATDATYVQEFQKGLAACEATCEFWDDWRGAQAGNRFFETGSFAVTETAHCRNTRQALIRAAATHLWGERMTTLARLVSQPAERTARLGTEDRIRTSTGPEPLRQPADLGQLEQQVTATGRTPPQRVGLAPSPQPWKGRNRGHPQGS